jgi:hypothetical protein
MYYGTVKNLAYPFHTFLSVAISSNQRLLAIALNVIYLIAHLDTNCTLLEVLYHPTTGKVEKEYFRPSTTHERTSATRSNCTSLAAERRCRKKEELINKCGVRGY